MTNMVDENEREGQRMLAFGQQSPRSLLDKVAQGDQHAAYAAQMLCTTAHDPWVQEVGMEPTVQAFSACIEKQCTGSGVKVRSLYSFCLTGLNNVWVRVDDNAFNGKLRHLHKNHVMPTIARALTSWDVISPNRSLHNAQPFDGRLNFFFFAASAIKPHVLEEFGEAPFVKIAPYALELLVLKDDVALLGARPEQARLLLVNVIHRLVDLEPVQIALWQSTAELGLLVGVLTANQDPNISMDILDILIEMGKTYDGEASDMLWGLPGLADVLVKFARRSAFGRKEGYGDPTNTATSRQLSLGCLFNMCLSRKQLKWAWKAGVFDAALVALRAGDDEIRDTGSALVRLLSEDLAGLHKNAGSAITISLLEQASNSDPDPDPDPNPDPDSDPNPDPDSDPDSDPDPDPDPGPGPGPECLACLSRRARWAPSSRKKRGVRSRRRWRTRRRSNRRGRVSVRR